MSAKNFIYIMKTARKSFLILYGFEFYSINISNAIVAPNLNAYSNIASSV